MGLIRPATLIGKFGITNHTVEPFGLKAEYFYDQMQHATGMAHVFLYTFNDDVVGFFAALIHEAYR
jgi:ABC-type transporter Mla maintaining outer membrane lipid asymmetry permease subunit MlaE